jgi:hypothetical protein
MKFSEKRIKAILSRHEQLVEYAWQYTRDKFPNARHGDVRFYNERVEEYVNTSCHCHPIYDWEDRGSLDDFIEWLEK